MELKQITNRIYYMEAYEVTDRPILGYIKGDKYSLAIDAGNSKNHVLEFYSLLENKGLPKPKYTVITHYHWDHTFGMHAISGNSILSNLTNIKLEEMKNWNWTKNDMDIRIEKGFDIEFCKNHIVKEYKNLDDIKVVTGDIIFNDELSIDLGGIKCYLMHIVSPHTDDTIVAYIPSEKILFIGDSDGGDYNNLNGNYDKVKLKKYINFIENLDYEISIVGHGEPESKDNTLKYLYEELSKC